MEGKQQSKLHHFVPQGYLRGFANDKEQVKVVPLEPSRTPFITASRHVTAQNHFHTRRVAFPAGVLEHGHLPEPARQRRS